MPRKKKVTTKKKNNEWKTLFGYKFKDDNYLEGGTKESLEAVIKEAHANLTDVGGEEEELIIYKLVPIQKMKLGVETTTNPNEK